LASDGTFIGAEGLSGSVDTDQWTLVSDIEKGEPPRFAPRAQAAVAGSDGTQWFSLGSDTAGTNGAIGQSVLAVAVSGETVYAGGIFQNAGGDPLADFVARWNGTSWSALGTDGAGGPALNSTVFTLLFVSPNLYVGGAFTNAGGNPAADKLAMYNGSSWSGFGASGDITSQVHAIAVYTTNVYIGGDFTNVHGQATIDHIARWDGANWNGLGNNSAGDGALNAGVYTLAVAGSTVYAGGAFTNAANIAEADRIAMWNGSAWSALGSNGAGDGALNNVVNSVAFQHGTAHVVAGGVFQNAANIAAADFVARWTGTAWEAISPASALNGDVKSVSVVGNNIYVVGGFQNAAGIPTADYVARWDGSAWSGLGDDQSGDGAINAIVLYAVAASGYEVVIGGNMANAANIAQADAVAMAIVPNAWSNLGYRGGNTTLGALPGLVRAIAIVGGAVYVGGDFLNAANIPEADYIAKWNGFSWSALGNNGSGFGAINNSVRALAVSGTKLYVGGSFTDAGGNTAADRVALWDTGGLTWSSLGATSAITNGHVHAIAIHGSDVFVGGSFTNAGPDPAADFVARFNNGSWFALSSTPLGNAVFALATSTTALYVGGQFANAGGLAEADFVAGWNFSNSTWFALGNNGAGVGALSNIVWALATSGAVVYAGGDFVDAGGVATADRIAKFSGGQWSGLGSSPGGIGAIGNSVRAILVHNASVYVGGLFNDAGNVPTADRIAVFKNGSWYPLADNGAGLAALNESVFAMAATTDDLYAGGNFTNVAGMVVADYIAEFGPITTYQPDGRIKKGTGTLIGNDIYSNDGSNQVRTGTAAIGSTVTFTISIQNDGDGPDQFRVYVSGAAVTGYQVNYFRGTTNITAQVVGGSYITGVVAPGSTFAIKAKVKVVTGATNGSSVTRVVVIDSAAVGSSKEDAVKFTVSKS
jgi:hypothetical protein